MSFWSTWARHDLHPYAQSGPWTGRIALTLGSFCVQTLPAGRRKYTQHVARGLQERHSWELFAEATPHPAVVPGAWHPHNPCQARQPVHRATAVLAPLQLGHRA